MKSIILGLLLLLTVFAACEQEEISGDAKSIFIESEGIDTEETNNLNLIERSFTKTEVNVCENLAAPIDSRAGSKECLEKLVKSGYFDEMKVLDFDLIIFKLVSLGASHESAEWAAVTNSFLFTDSFSNLETNEDGIFDTNVDSQCDDFGGGCGQCVFVDGDDVFSYQWCIRPCETVINIVIYQDGITSSNLYSHQGC